MLYPDTRGRMRRVSESPVSLSRGREGQSGVYGSARGEGRHVFVIGRTSPPDRLVFRSPANGTTVLDLPPAWCVNGPPPEVTVRLSGEGRIHGRVVDPNGAAVAGLELRAAWVSRADSREQRDIERRALLFEGAGRIELETETEVDGTFAFEGLSRRWFVVTYVGPEPFGDAPWESLDERLVELDRVNPAVDASPRTYEVTRSCVEVRVRSDGLKRAQSDAAVEDHEEWIHDRREMWIEIYDAGPLEGPAWVVPDTHSLDVLAGRAVRRSLVLLERKNTLRRYALPSGRRYLVTGSVGEHRARSVLVELPEAFSVGRVTLDAECLLGHGRLKVDLDLAPLPRGTDERGDGRVGLWIEDVETGEPVVRRVESQDIRRSDLIRRSGFRVPPGRYRVVAMGIHGVESYHGTVTSRRQYGRAESVVDVVVDQITTARLHLGAGARLRVEIRGAWSEADERALEGVDVRALSGAWMGADERDRVTGVHLMLDAVPSRLSTPVVRVGPARMGGSAAGLHVIDWWPLGETHTSEVVPAGTYILRATHATRPPIERIVTIGPGETVDLVLDLGS
ncbi:MAG: hypothetical protein AAF726_13120 [Planctomycetota bacterium]